MIRDYELAVVDALGFKALEAAKAHAIAEFPKESCGYITKPGDYVACENVHEAPEEFFRIDDPGFERDLCEGAVRAVVHSHPNGPIFPSHADMMGQIASDLPWVIVSLNEVGIHKIVAWGGELPVAPLIGRPFVHGIFDCYTLLRDIFRLGKDRCLEQGVHWPLPPIELPEVARADDWWKDGEDLYSKHFETFGFKIISRSEARPGDVFLKALGDGRENPHKQFNHAGMLLEHDQILQQLPNRLSQRTPFGVWGRAADVWIRYDEDRLA